MAIRYLIMPLITEPTRWGRGPKYLGRWGGNPSGMDVWWRLYDFGKLPLCLIITDITAAQYTTLTANTDVIGIPANIDNTITAAALPTVRAKLEAMRIPGNWVTTANTYRQVLRMVAGLFQFAQRHHGLHDQIIIPDAINLDQTWGDIPAAWQANLRATADSFGLDYSQVTNVTTIRTILKRMGDDWGSTPFVFDNTTL